MLWILHCFGWRKSSCLLCTLCPKSHEEPINLSRKHRNCPAEPLYKTRHSPLVWEHWSHAEKNQISFHAIASNCNLHDPSKKFWWTAGYVSCFLSTAGIPVGGKDQASTSQKCRSLAGAGGLEEIALPHWCWKGNNQSILAGAPACKRVNSDVPHSFLIYK